MPQNVTTGKSTWIQVKVGAVNQQAVIWANVDPDELTVLSLLEVPGAKILQRTLLFRAICVSYGRL